MTECEGCGWTPLFCRCPIVVSEEDGALLRRPPAPLKITIPMVKIEGEWVRAEDPEEQTRQG